MPKFVTGYILDQEYDPDTDEFAWGARCREGNREYILCKFNHGAGEDTAVAGQMLAQMIQDGDHGHYEGTNDLNDPLANINHPLGQMQCAPDDEMGVWCQYSGWNTLDAVTGTNVAAKSVCALDSATVGGIDPIVYPTETRVGVAGAADSATVLEAGALMLQIQP